MTENQRETLAAALKRLKDRMNSVQVQLCCFAFLIISNTSSIRVCFQGSFAFDAVPHAVAEVHQETCAETVREGMPRNAVGKDGLVHSLPE